MDSHKNFATSLVATAPSPATSGTSLVVTGGEGTRFPATPFNAVVCPATSDATPANAEVVRVTGISTDTFTITRATESSVARTVVVGDRIYAGATAKSLTDIEAADAAAATASLRTLGTGATQAMQGSLAAPLASPTFTGTPAAPTAAALTSTTQLATTAYVDNADTLAGSQYVPTGVTYQNFSRYQRVAVTGAVVASGTLKLVAIWLPTGFTVTSITFASGTTALTTAGSGPHFWMALFDSSRVLLRQTTDDTAATWSASSLKTVNLSSQFVTTYTGLHYLGLGINCGSTGAMPTVVTGIFDSAALMTFPPILNGNSTTSITGTAPGTAATITPVGTNVPYCGVA